MESLNSVKSARGIALIEALISMLLIAITVAGSLYVVNRANTTKTEMSLQEIAVHQLRSKLMNHGSGGADLCANAGNIIIPNGTEDGHTVAVTVDSGCVDAATPVAVTVGGTEITGMHGRIALSINDASLGGQIIVGGS